jgi:hypothetical protein
VRRLHGVKPFEQVVSGHGPVIRQLPEIFERNTFAEPLARSPAEASGRVLVWSAPSSLLSSVLSS